MADTIMKLAGNVTEPWACRTQCAPCLSAGEIGQPPETLPSSGRLRNLADEVPAVLGNYRADQVAEVPSVVKGIVVKRVRRSNGIDSGLSRRDQVVCIDRVDLLPA